jgi:hypothetical protein
MGAKVEHCPHCGEALPVVRDAYCLACRSALADEPAGEGATPATGQASSPDGPEGKPGQGWVVDAAILCFLAGIGCLCLNESLDPPDPVLEWVGVALCAPCIVIQVLVQVATLLACVILSFTRRKAG